MLDLAKFAGKMIVFEGVEGSGKTTQLQRLCQWLASGETLPVIVTRQPGGTQLGLKLRQLLLTADGENPIQDLAELFLYAADRAQHVAEVLKPQLELGAVVLCDRYVDSTVAYQGYGRGLNLNLIHQLNSIATSGLESDLTIWLDVDVEVARQRTQSRGVADRIEQEAIAFHRRVEHGYRELAKTYPERIFRVDGSLNQETVQAQIQAILCQRLTENKK